MPYESQYAVPSSDLVNIAEQVRRLSETEELLTVDEMATVLATVEAGGGGGATPDYIVWAVSVAPAATTEISEGN